MRVAFESPISRDPFEIERAGGSLLRVSDMANQRVIYVTRTRDWTHCASIV